MSEEKKNVPKLRFPEFEEEWVLTPLDKFTKRVTRKNTDNKVNRPLTISSIDGLVDQNEYFNKRIASHDVTNYYILKNGEFAYNKSYSNGFPLGSIKRLDRYPDGVLSTLYICFAIKSKNIDSDFLTQYFNSSKWNKQVSMISTEGARNHGLLNVSPVDFFKTTHYLPSYQEQRKIADFLSALDERITLLEEKLERVEILKKGFMQKIFNREIRFKDENGEEYPEWERRKFEELVTLSKEKYNPKLKNEYYESIELENIVSNTGKVKSKSKIDGRSSIKNKYSVGDILFGKLRPYLQKYAISDDAGVCSTEIWVFKVKQEINNWWLFGEIQTNLFLQQVNKTTGTKMPRADWHLVKEILFSVPSIEEQTKIGSFYEEIMNFIETGKKDLLVLKRIKKILSNFLFKDIS